MRKKTIMKTLAALLAVSTFMTACGNSEVSESIESTNSAKESSEEAKEQPKMYWEMLDEVSDSSELPDWTGEKLEITVWAAGGTDAVFGKIPENNVTYKEIERVTGIVINVEDSITNGGDSIDAKLPKLIASGDFPTLVYGHDNIEHFKDLYDNGYLADLSEYYENGSLDHVQYWLPMDKMETTVYSKLRAEDGADFLIPSTVLPKYHMAADYSVPEIDLEYFNLYGQSPENGGGASQGAAIWVRDDVLKAVRPDALTAAEIKEIYVENGTFTEDQIFDLKLKSTQDLVDLLHDIKEELASGEYVGLDGGEVEVTYGPDSGADNWGWMKNLPPVFSGFVGDYFTILTKEGAADGSLFEWGFKSDVYLEHMKTINGLVRDDIISQNSLVDNAATFNEKLNNGRYAVAYYTSPDKIGDADADGVGDAGWLYRPVWVDFDYDKTVKLAGLPTLKYYGIFKDSVPEGQMDQLIHYIDYINSMVGLNVLYYGPQSAGLFTVDAEGNRVYTDPEVEACMVDRVDNGASAKYGFYNIFTQDPIFMECFPVAHHLYHASPAFNNIYKSNASAASAFKYFNPGILPGKSGDDFTVVIDGGYNMYNFGLSVESIANFWTARAGFEEQMKKVLVAESDAEYEAQLEELFNYAKEFGLTDEALKEYNDLVIEENYNSLKAAGFVK